MTLEILMATSKGSHNLMYLPLEKLLSLPNPNSDTNTNQSDTAQVAAAASTVSTSPETPSTPDNNSNTTPSGYAARGYNFNNQEGQ